MFQFLHQQRQILHEQRRRRLRGASALVAGLAVALFAAAPAAAGAAPPSPGTAQMWTVDVGAQSPDGAIQTMGFYPAHLWIDQGDTVTWTVRSLEPHTVTFLSTDSPCPAGALCTLTPFDPTDPLELLPQGSGTYDGHSYYNSGLMTTATEGLPLPPGVPIETSSTLTFPADLAPGTYTYVCLLHGQRMTGQITVQAAGTPYPFGQLEYRLQSHAAATAAIADGYRLWAGARARADQLTRTNGPTVLVGAMDDNAMVMRFVPDTVIVPAGDAVTFLSNAMDTPHTVTFGNDETGCGAPPCNPFAPWNVTFGQDGNVTANYPGLNGGFTGDPANLSSGVMFDLPPALTGAPSRLTLTLTKAGTFRYFCALHDFMGMAGRIIALRGSD